MSSIDDTGSTTEPETRLTVEEANAILREENEAYYRTLLGVPSPTPPAPAEPLSREDQVRAQLQAAHEAREARANDVKLAKAYLQEVQHYSDAEVAALTDAEALQIVTLEETPAQKEARERDEYDRAVLANPELLEAELTRRAAEREQQGIAGIEALKARNAREAEKQAKARQA